MKKAKEIPFPSDAGQLLAYKNRMRTKIDEQK
jgi:hypothetical protein